MMSMKDFKVLQQSIFSSLVREVIFLRAIYFIVKILKDLKLTETKLIFRNCTTYLECRIFPGGKLHFKDFLSYKS